MKIATVVGARPQFVKAAPVSRALRERGHQEILVHTGQYYDDAMSRRFFDRLRIPDPDINLEVGSGSHGQQTGLMLGKLEQVLRDRRPDAVLVFSDTNSTLAGALAAIKLDIPVVHAEAGERIYRRDRNPEEINRIITDHAAWLNLTVTERARQYLLREGMGPDRARFVGDPMYDVFCWSLKNGLHLTESEITPEVLGLEPRGYHLSTIHRVENTDRPDHLVHLLTAMDRASKPVLLSMHPRLKRLIQEAGFVPKLNLRLIEPQGYFEFLRLLVDCDKVITDSGGVSKESFFAGKPCIIPMENSWWADIVEAGWAVETGADYERLGEAIESHVPPDHVPPSLFGDGSSAVNIARELEAEFEPKASDGPWHPHGYTHTFPKQGDRGGRFTYSEYLKLLDGFRESGYRFSAFPETQALLETNSSFVLLRHDIDMSLEAALRLAELEARIGVIATYFFLVRTDHYNVFSRTGSQIVNRIVGLGHHLGLHFDCGSYDEQSVDRLQQACSDEANLLEHWFGKAVEIVSYHRPSELVLSGVPELSAPRPHTYMSMFNRDMTYLSDSRGRWRTAGPLQSEAFKQRQPLHLLVHPIWWSESQQSPYDTLSRFVLDHRTTMERSLANNCEVFQVGHLKQTASR